MTDIGKCPAFGYDCEYVSKVEAQAVEIEELKSWKAAEDAHHHKLRAEIERLREALNTIGYDFNSGYLAVEIARKALGETE